MGQYEQSLVDAAKERRARIFGVVPVINIARRIPKVAAVAPAEKALPDFAGNWLEQPRQKPAGYPVQWMCNPPPHLEFEDIDRRRATRLVPMPARSVMRQIVRYVADELGLTPAEIIGPDRRAPIVRGRQIVMYLAKKITDRSYPSIGRQLNDRDHTTVLHGCRKVEGLLQVDPDLVALVARLEARLAQ